MWNARGDRGYLSDGTSSGLDELSRVTGLNLLVDEKRIFTKPKCSRLVCDPNVLNYTFKELDKDDTVHGVICQGILCVNIIFWFTFLLKVI